VLYPDNALLHAIIRNAHCPDPRCAARYRPFARVTERLRPAMTQVSDPSPCCLAEAPEPNMAPCC
jgi:hypothetical protein